MTVEETGMLIAVIKTVYPEFVRDLDLTAVVRVWNRVLSPYDYKLCEKAIGQHIEECKFAPKPSEIIERVKKMMPELPSRSKHDDNEYMGTWWERRSMQSLIANLGTQVDYDMAKLIYRNEDGLPMPIPHGVIKRRELPEVAV